MRRHEVRTVAWVDDTLPDEQCSAGERTTMLSATLRFADAAEIYFTKIVERACRRRRVSACSGYFHVMVSRRVLKRKLMINPTTCFFADRPDRSSRSEEFVQQLPRPPNSSSSQRVSGSLRAASISRNGQPQVRARGNGTVGQKTGAQRATKRHRNSVTPALGMSAVGGASA